MARKAYKARIGSISHGTLRTEDLLDAFAGEIDGCKLSRAQRKLVNEAHAWLAQDEDTRDDENGSTMVEELSDVLNELAPPYVYFGTLEGDGSDFGFWPAHESLQDDLYSGELLHAENTPKGYSGLAAEINDHGNITLFRYIRGRRVILWDCV